MPLVSPPESFLTSYLFLIIWKYFASALFFPFLFQALLFRVTDYRTCEFPLSSKQPLFQHMTPTSRAGSKKNVADDAKSEASSFARRNKMPGSMGWLDSNKGVLVTHNQSDNTTVIYLFDKFCNQQVLKFNIKTQIQAIHHHVFPIAYLFAYLFLGFSKFPNCYY